MTWPLPARLAHGGRTDKGDGLFSIWVVAWVSHALITSPAHLFDANIFYPEKETLAYSEANVGAGALGVPVWIATHNPYATHNAVVLMAFALAFVAMYLLARQLVGPGPPAIVAGVLFAFCPYVFGHTANIQLLMTAGLPAAMTAMHRLVERPGPWPAIALGLVLFAQAISCGYYGILAGMLVTAGVLVFSVTRGLWRRRDWWTWVGVAAGLAIALSLPFLEHYLGLTARTGFHRELSDAAYYAANLHAWTASSAILHHWMVHEPQDWPEVIFPGFVALALGVGGLAMSLRTSANRSVVARHRRVLRCHGRGARLAHVRSAGRPVHGALPRHPNLRVPALAVAVLHRRRPGARGGRRIWEFAVPAAMAARAVAGPGRSWVSR